MKRNSLLNLIVVAGMYCVLSIQSFAQETKPEEVKQTERPRVAVKPSPQKDNKAKDSRAL
jgi:hypothetical protein